MKLRFNKIKTTNGSITIKGIEDTDKVYYRKDFNDLLANGIDIDKWVLDTLDNISIVGKEEHKPTFEQASETEVEKCDIMDNSFFDSDGYPVESSIIPGVNYRIGDNETSIMSGLFAEIDGSSNLTEVTIADSITEIGSNAFRNCVNLVKVTFSNNLKTIEGDAFNGDESLEEADLPSSLTSLGEFAFSGCSSLEEIELPTYIKTVSDSTFYGCSNLKTVKLSEKTENIYANAFYECKSLTAIDLPDTIRNICEYAFYGCSSLTNIKIPNNSSIKIENGAFEDCTSLTTITIPSIIPDTYDEAYEYYNENGYCLNGFDGIFSGCDNITTINYAGNQLQFAWLLLIDDMLNSPKLDLNALLTDESLMSELNSTISARFGSKVVVNYNYTE